MMRKDEIKEVDVTKVGNIPSSRLNEELALVDEPFWYYLIEATDADGNVEREESGLAWLKKSERAIILWNEQIVWTRAESPQDAAERWLEDRMETPPVFQ